MGKEENTARRGRGRPRKQDFGIKPVCTAPVIELTSSSEDDEPPPKPATPIRKPPVIVKSVSSKPPILAKRTLSIQKPPIQLLRKPSPLPEKVQKLADTDKVRKLTDTEQLLSILENDEDELEGLPMMKEGRKNWESSHDKIERTKDILLKSIEDELRYLDEVDDTPSKPAQRSLLNDVKITKKDVASTKIPVRRSSVEIIDEIKALSKEPVIKSKPDTPKLGSEIVIRRVTKPEKKVTFGSPLTIKDDMKRKFSEIRKADEARKERTKILSPSDVKLPPEVLEAIKKRSNLGRIEKIVEKTDANHKSKYIVIFNRGAGTPRKKGSIDEEIEALLKSLPSKTPPAKKQKTDLREIVPKVKQPPKVTLPTRLPFQHSPSMSSTFEKAPVIAPVVTPAKPVEKKSPSLAASEAPVVAADEKTVEEPVRFTESPLGNEPPLPWDTSRGDGFEKYFKTVERLIEHHDSLDSDSDFDEPQMFSHFKNAGRTDVQADNQKVENDQISVTNIANTMAKEFPGWNVEAVAGSDTICLTRTGSNYPGSDRRGSSTGPKKLIKIASDYNVSVIVNNTAIPEYEGMYDSFDNIKQLVREIDQL
uniref:Segregation and condensation protein B n=1 Tax=Lygus hesperus TaxID=30085 RepID=A0A0A9WDX8_LYGHE